MSATNTPMLVAAETGPWLVKTFGEAFPKAYRMIWDAVMPVLAANWGWVLLTLFVAFTYVSIKAFMGRWGALGSFLYNFFYFGTLFIIGLIWGPEVFAGDLFRAACTVILYPICYLLVGVILDKTGVRRRF